MADRTPEQRIARLERPEAEAVVLRAFMEQEMPPGTDFESALWGATDALIRQRAIPAVALVAAQKQVARLQELAQVNFDLYHEAMTALRAVTGERDVLRVELDMLREEVAAGTASDGHHTHRELYDYRMLYNAHAALGWLAAGLSVVKSRKHSDGEPCFGGGWFIVTAMLPTGQVSNHYRDEHWGLFAVPEVDLPPEYDGHTPADAADRLRALLTPRPTDTEDPR